MMIENSCIVFVREEYSSLATNGLLEGERGLGVQIWRVFLKRRVNIVKTVFLG
jgi:hypothetical protein